MQDAGMIHQAAPLLLGARSLPSLDAAQMAPRFVRGEDLF